MTPIITTTTRMMIPIRRIRVTSCRAAPIRPIALSATGHTTRRRGPIWGSMVCGIPARNDQAKRSEERLEGAALFMRAILRLGARRFDAHLSGRPSRP